MQLDVEHTLERRWISLARIAGWIRAVVLGGTLFLGAVVAVVATRPGFAGAVTLVSSALAAFVLLAALGHFWPEAAWKRASWRLGEGGLEIRRGVLFRTVTFVPRSRVQHTDVSQGPLERQFRLATLVVHTAGTLHASVDLPGLSRETAVEIRDLLVAGNRGDAV